MKPNACQEYCKALQMHHTDKHNFVQKVLEFANMNGFTRQDDLSQQDKNELFIQMGSDL